MTETPQEAALKYANKGSWSIEHSEKVSIVYTDSKHETYTHYLNGFKDASERYRPLVEALERIIRQCNSEGAEIAGTQIINIESIAKQALTTIKQ